VNKLKKYLFFSFLLGWSQLTQAYILNQTKSGIPVHWPSSSSIIDIFVNSQNTQSLNETSVQNIAANSLSQWSGVAQVSIRKNVTTTKNQADLNELYFTTDPNVFNGTGVIGVTQVGFKETTGEILEADILINDNYTFSTDPNELSYLGNVITHESGHFLGLGHGQVAGSTMFYALARGQYVLSNDDKAALYSTYPTGDATKGSLTGKIIGGKNLIPVFGTHVQAISVKTGKVMGASISELDGKFKINGLSQNDQYLIYTSPIKQLGLPTNYANVKNDFCESSKPYRGSFYQSCGSRGEGFPQAVALTSSSKDLGNITIRCGLDSPPEYFQKKGITPSTFDVNSYATVGLGGSFVGFFSTAEMLPGTNHDYFAYDFSSITDWDTVSTSTSLYLELKITNQAFYSPFKANVSIKRNSGTTNVVPEYNQESDGWLNLDTVVRVPINRADPSDNNLEITITPEDMLNSFPAGIPYAREDFFPSYSDFHDGLYFYLATATIVIDNGSGSYVQVSSKSDVLSDNTQCPDASNTYALTSYSANGTSSSNSSRKKFLGCGTIDDTGNSTGGGPGGFFVGLIVSFIIASALSRYSKLA
jgi:hypothetical protein